jgi:hypothetical protein
VAGNRRPRSGGKAEAAAHPTMTSSMNGIVVKSRAEVVGEGPCEAPKGRDASGMQDQPERSVPQYRSAGRAMKRMRKKQEDIWIRDEEERSSTRRNTQSRAKQAGQRYRGMGSCSQECQ